MSKLREIKWPEEFVELKQMEDEMVCNICYDYMETSVMAPCSHNYCSLCIRKYLHYKTECPTCSHNFYEKDLCTNRALDTLIKHYKSVREKLFASIQNKIIIASPAPVNSNLPKSPSVFQQTQSPPRTPKANFFCNNEAKSSPTMNHIDMPHSAAFNASPSTSKQAIVLPNIAKIFNTPKVRKETTLNIDIKTVSCPVCNVDISEQHINKHLDACLSRENNQKLMAKNHIKEKRPPMPKIVFRLMKDSEVRKKMKEYGLSSIGDKKTLENRFLRYSSIYNAERDKENPRPIPELIKQCEQEEKQERTMDSYFKTTTVPTSRLQVDRNAKEEVIDDAQKKYREAHKSHFDKLIEEVKKRRLEKKNQAAIIDSVENDSKFALESEGTSNHCNNEIADAEFHDSDSDESSCPLQIYKSDDPMVSQKYLNSSSNTTPSNSPQKISTIITSNSNSPSFKRHSSNKSNKSIYDAETDISEEDDIPNSPELKQKRNNSKTKKKFKSLNKSSSSLSQEEIQQELAKEMCNSIINDFSFDDSFDEFEDSENVIKPTEEKKDIFGSSAPDIDGLSNVNKSTKENSFVNLVIHDAPFSITRTADDSLNGLLCNNGLSISEQIAQIEKENDSLKINKNLENDVNSAKNVRENDRPVRRRTRTKRFADESSSLSNNDSSVINELLVNNNCSKVSALSEPTLKRRRGRSKVNDSESLEFKSPPKRAVRRKIVASDVK